jgi:hypothetical protein
LQSPSLQTGRRKSDSGDFASSCFSRSRTSPTRGDETIFPSPESFASGVTRSEAGASGWVDERGVTGCETGAGALAARLPMELGPLVGDEPPTGDGELGALA